MPTPKPSTPATTQTPSLVPPDVLVLAGDAAERTDVYTAHLQVLWNWYRPEGPVEEDLVVRIAELRWRLQRVAQAERGVIGGRAFTTRQDRAKARRTQATHERDLRPYEHTQLGPESNPALVRSALASIHILQFKVLCGGVPTAEEVNQALTPFYGTDEFGRPMGEGLSVAGSFEWLRDAPTDPDLSERQRTAALKKARKDATEALAQSEAACAAIYAQCEARAQAQDDALVDARRVLPVDSMRGFASYERHLEASIERATRELERTVARRRLAGVGVRAGMGRLR